MAKFVPNPNLITTFDGSPQIVDIRINSAHDSDADFDQHSLLGPRLEIVFDRPVHVEKDGEPIANATDVLSTHFNIGHKGPDGTFGDRLSIQPLDVDTNFNMLESGMVLSVYVRPNLYTDQGYSWPEDHRFGINEISSDFIIRDLNGTEVLLKDIIPQNYYWANNDTADSPISIASGKLGWVR